MRRYEAKNLIFNASIFVFAIIVCSNILCVDIVSAVDYSNSESLILNVYIKNSFSIDYSRENSYVDSINATLLSFPRTDGRQDNYFISINPEGYVDDKSITFNWERSQKKHFNILVESEVRTKYGSSYGSLYGSSNIKDKTPFPIKNSNALYEYVAPTEIIDVTPEIKDLAASLSLGKNDLFEVEYAFAEYVRRNIQYDLGTLTSDVNQKSSWVLGNRIGVCDELTNLFISLNRAVGVPARFVSGIAYTDLDNFDSNWVSHAWAEVYFPGVGWVPYDVTYGQYGYVDSSHIKLMESPDGHSPSIRYNYVGEDILLTPEDIETEVVVLEASKKYVPDYEFSASILEDEIGFGSYNIVYVDIENIDAYYVVADLYLAETAGVSIIEESKEFVLGKQIHRKQVLLKPFESKKISWIIKIDDDLRKNYIYTFPITVYNSLNQSSMTRFESREVYDHLSKPYVDGLVFESENKGVYNDQVSFRCEDVFEKEKYYVNDSFSIECIIDNKADKIFDATICSENFGECTDIRLPIQKVSVQFNGTLDEIGINTFLLRLEADDLEKSSFVNIRAIDVPVVEIINVNHPVNVRFNEPYSIVFDIEKSSYSTPENVIVQIISQTSRTEWKISELSEARKFVFNSDGKSLKPGVNNFEIIIDYRDDLHDTSEKFQTRKTFTITSEANSFENIVLYVNQISFFVEGLFH
ncbi:MAG: transglutaminase-like domain-containing protein [Candidatus Woesearchaeota archaeon]